VPIVASAVLFDLGIGLSDIRLEAKMGCSTCLSASSLPVIQGNFGAGAGATVGKILGSENGMKSGVGSAMIDIGGGIIIGALIAVNAFGDIVLLDNGKIITGARSISLGPIHIGDSTPLADTLAVMKTIIGRSILKFSASQNTIIGVVATNAKLTKEETNKVAQMAQDGIASVVRPAHTMLDGDTIFALATCKRRTDVNIVGAFASEVVSRAIINAITFAKPEGGLPAYIGN
jgi:L-aminopeptidase/D-esterase-like protein